MSLRSEISELCHSFTASRLIKKSRFEEALEHVKQSGSFEEQEKIIYWGLKDVLLESGLEIRTTYDLDEFIRHNALGGVDLLFYYGGEKKRLMRVGESFERHLPDNLLLKYLEDQRSS